MAEKINTDNPVSQALPQLDQSNTRQMQAYHLIADTNQSFFLTGRAGTGKTTFLKNVQQLTGKQFIVVAPTGIAAIVAGGVTIHSFFGLDLHVLGPKDHGKNFSEDKIEMVRRCDTILIDEVSMVRCDTIDAIDYTLRIIMRTSMPFGGKQVIFSGDMFQLPPVLRAGAEADAMREFYGTDVPFFFKAHVFDRLTIPTIEFVKVYRQEDPLFLNILSDIRGGACTPADLHELNARCVEPQDDEDPIISLTPRRDTAQQINDGRLSELGTEEHTYVGQLDGNFAKKDKDGNVKEDGLPAPLSLTLKVGAQVMFTRNDSSHRWVNGTLATVTALTDDSIEVKIGEAVVSVDKAVWESYDYELDKKEKKLNKKTAGTFTQYPLRLAWAITIHKSQGLTFDRMILDLSRGTFAAGQLYVALSRVRSLDGLYLTRPVKYTDIRKDEEVLRFASKFNDDSVIEQQIAEGSALYPFLKSMDYDGAALKYAELARQAIADNRHQQAAGLLKKMMNVMIADAPLMGRTYGADLNPAENQVAWFNNAVLCLFGSRFEEAIGYADRILAQRRLYEALYIKTRALFALGRTAEADALNVEMSEVLQAELGDYDMKFIYSFATVNEAIGDPCLGAYLKIAIERPDYIPAHAALHAAVHKQRKCLSLAEGYDLPELGRLFNSLDDSAAFVERLQATYTTDRSLFEDYIDLLSKQSFES